MSRNRLVMGTLSLTSLMDVFTILVFYLLVNSSSPEVLTTPKQLKLPDSTIETKPRETLVIFISPTEVTVQGEVVALVSDIEASQGQNVAAIAASLLRANESVIGTSTRAVAQSREVTLLADKSVPFSVVKKVMSTCTSEGFEKISLAVTQKAPELAQR